jgi:hypothetical protein
MKSECWIERATGGLICGKHKQPLRETGTFKVAVAYYSNLEIDKLLLECPNSGMLLYANNQTDEPRVDRRPFPFQS